MESKSSICSLEQSASSEGVDRFRKTILMNAGSLVGQVDECLGWRTYVLFEAWEALFI